MTFKNNIMVFYTVITFGLTLIISLIIGNILATQSKRTLILTHADMYPVFVSHMVKYNPSVLNYFKYGSGSDIPTALKNHIVTLSEIDSVFSVKLWNSDAEIIWSDNEEVIGQQFQNNDILTEALEGSVSYEITRPIEEEHQFKDDPGLILELYMPVTENEGVIGAIELYERDDNLNTKITTQVRLVWIIMMAGGLFLYLMLFFLFYRSYKRQKTITEQVKQTEKVTIYALAYQAGLRDEETGKHLKRTTEYVRFLSEELKKENILTLPS